MIPHQPKVLRVWCRLWMRSGSPASAARAWFQGEYSDRKLSVVPLSVAVHGQGCVLHHIILNRKASQQANYAHLIYILYVKTYVCTVFIVTIAHVLDITMDLVVSPFMEDF